MYTHEEMKKASVLNNHSTHLFHHPPISKIQEFFKGYITWSGFMGGELTGAGLLKHSSRTKKETITNFFNQHNYINSVNLTDSKQIDIVKYLDFNQAEFGQLTLDEQLNFSVRQKKYIYYHTKIFGENILYPFLENEWSNFILSMYKKYRQEKKCIIIYYTVHFQYLNLKLKI